MANPFHTDSLAAGYANSRPPVHPRVIEFVRQELNRTSRFRCALDVGCGAGLSTRALSAIADRCIGLEPVEAMLRYAAASIPESCFLLGNAEALPLQTNSVDLIAAAGSLNYVDLQRFFPEAARVLTPDGVLLIYDFSAGRNFRNSSKLEEWFTAFRERYPQPVFEARTLNPEIIGSIATGFRLLVHQNFEIGLPLTQQFYLEYVLTETNVAAKLREGVPRSEIRAWCAESLGAFWSDEAPREVLFRGYFACLAADLP